MILEEGKKKKKDILFYIRAQSMQISLFYSALWY